MNILHIASLIFFAALSVASSSASAQKFYSAEERMKEEARIQKEIEENLDWKNRTKETLDEYNDQERMLYGTINESVLLTRHTGERFGVFESFRDNGRKAIEVRLHNKNKLIDRYFLYGDACKGASIFARKIAKEFGVFEMGCYTIGKSGQIEGRFEPYLFDQSSRNFYRLAALDYDPKENKAPSITYEKGIYKMHWSVRLKGDNKDTFVSRRFRIQNERGVLAVKELPPIDHDAASISPLQRLTVKAEFDLPLIVTGK